MLRTMKTNYGRAGGEIRLRWHDGVFVLDTDAETNLAQSVKHQHAEDVFLELLPPTTRPADTSRRRPGPTAHPRSSSKRSAGNQLASGCWKPR